MNILLLEWRALLVFETDAVFVFVLSVGHHPVQVESGRGLGKGQGSERREAAGEGEGRGVGGVGGGCGNGHTQEDHRRPAGVPKQTQRQRYLH